LAMIAIDISSVIYRHMLQSRESVFPSTLLQLLKENAAHSAASLVEDCMVQLTLHGIMGKHTSYTVNHYIYTRDYISLIFARKFAHEIIVFAKFRYAFTINTLNCFNFTTDSKTQIHDFTN